VAENPAINSSADLAAFINRLNQEGVSVYRRLSPPVLIHLMEVATELLAEYHASRDPYAMAPYGVNWAGEEKSANWFDTAREFTERWHHQQQIRLAVDKPGIMTRELYFPVLDCFCVLFLSHIAASPQSQEPTLKSSFRGSAVAAGIFIAPKKRGAPPKAIRRENLRDNHSPGNRLAHLHQGHQPRVRFRARACLR